MKGAVVIFHTKTNQEIPHLSIFETAVRVLKLLSSKVSNSVFQTSPIIITVGLKFIIDNYTKKDFPVHKILLT